MPKTGAGAEPREREDDNRLPSDRDIVIEVYNALVDRASACGADISGAVDYALDYLNALRDYYREV